LIEKRHINNFLLFLAGCALGIGASVYVFIRGPETLYVLQWFGDLPRLAPWVHASGDLRALVSMLPSATHAFAFSLLTALLLQPGRYAVIHACLLWGIIDSAFECLQAGKSFLGAHGADELLPRVAHAYIANGVFDWFDIGAIWIGVGLAALTLQLIRLPEHRGDERCRFA